MTTADYPVRSADTAAGIAYDRAMAEKHSPRRAQRLSSRAPRTAVAPDIASQENNLSSGTVLKLVRSGDSFAQRDLCLIRGALS